MTEIYIISGTSWTVPNDWSNTNTIETIGGGGGGGTPNASSFSGSGGGGGGYSKISNLSGLSGSLMVQVGAGGTDDASGGDTWFNGPTLGASSVGAKGGGAGDVNGHGGAGGAAANGVAPGGTKFSGGSGGSVPLQPWTGGGGGGAAGPNGDGAPGGAGSAIADGGGGGGGNSGGLAGGSPSGGSNNGGAGGSGGSGTGGGTGDTGSGPGDGTAGTGGGGGGARFQTSDNGGNGAGGSEFDASHGSGGGGGGGGGSNGTIAGNGGVGANYGGGGAGGGYPQSGTAWGIGGTGGNGIIVITYAPAISGTLIAESRNPVEYQTVGRIDALDSVEFSGSLPIDAGLPIEGRQEIRYGGNTPIEASSRLLSSRVIPIQSAGSLSVITDAFMPFEAAARLNRDTLGFVEFASVTSRRASGWMEWTAAHAFSTEIAVEHLGRTKVEFQLPSESRALLAGDVQFRLELLAIPWSEALLVLEMLTNRTRISACGSFYLEWADPPAALVLASERLLRSPGRVRILAGPRSVHPVRGQ